MSRSIETARVAPLLVGAAIKDVPGPLGQFQCTVFEREDVRKLVHSINRGLDEPVERRRLDETFDRLWPDLESRVQRIEKTARPAASVRTRPETVELGFVEASEALPPEQVEILKRLARSPKTYPTAALVARAIGENETRTEYHLDQLRGRGLINRRLVVGAPTTFYLTSEGRAYIVQNNLDRD